MKPGIRRKAFNLSEDMAHYLSIYVFLSRGRITHSDIAAEAFKRYRDEHPLPEDYEELIRRVEMSVMEHQEQDGAAAPSDGGTEHQDTSR